MTFRRWRHALSTGTYAGVCLFTASAVVIPPLVVMATASFLGGLIAMAACGAVATAGALLAAYGAYLDDLQTERRRRGCCPRCGYDLRESTGRCPECGGRFRRRERVSPPAEMPLPRPTTSAPRSGDRK